MGFMMIIGKRPSLEWFGLLPLMLVQLFLIISVGLMLGSVIPFAQDLKQIVDNLLMLMMFISGIFFSAESLPESAREAFRMNPMVPVVESYRDILMHNQWPPWGELGYVVLVSVPMLAIGLLMLHRYERQYPKLI